MAIWMGIDGGIRIERSASAPVYVYVSPEDVDLAVNALASAKYF